MQVAKGRSVQNRLVAENRVGSPGTRRRLVAIHLAIGAFLIAGAVGCGKSGEDYSRQVVRALDQGKLIGTKGSMETLARALSAYAIDHGGYPQAATLQGALEALAPAHLPAPVSVDAWNHPLSYRSDGQSYTLTAPGQDGAIGTDDDLEMTDGQFTRLPTRGGS